MKARYAESSVRISTTITDQERISRWGGTRPSRDRFSRRKWGQWWRCPRSVDCTTAMNGGPPERAGVYTSRSPVEIYVPTVLTCTRVSLRSSFTRLEHARELLRFTVRLGMPSGMGCTEFSLGTVAATVVESRRLAPNKDVDKPSWQTIR